MRGAILSGCLTLAACSPTSPGETPGAGSGAGSGAGGYSGGGAGAGAGIAGEGNGGSAAGDRAVGIVVVDVQEAFVSIAANPDMGGVIERAKSTFDLAANRNVPFFITFEGSQQGDHALHAPLEPHLPPQALDFVKTTFDATGLPSFSEAIAQSGLSHLVVLGAETDVCVMQTALGLRQQGFDVLLEQDTVFSSEPNSSPAVRRMRQAGVTLVNQAEIADFVENPSSLPSSDAAVVGRIQPLGIGVVLNAFTDASITASADPLATQKSARLRELLLVSEWFELPVYVADPGAGLPAAYTSYFLNALRPISQIGQDEGIGQLVIAGTDAGLAGALSGWIGGYTLFVMEDGLLSPSTPAALTEALEPFFDAGLVPITYKSFYYEMTRSVDLGQWPSTSWVSRFDEYFDITQAPEDLPPMPPS
jgi:nicotinamidase-related amidase